MRWLVKTSLDGIYCDEFRGEGVPVIPDEGTELMLPAGDGAFVPGVVSEVNVDQSHSPAVLRIVCVSPDQADKESRQLRRLKPR